MYRPWWFPEFTPREQKIFDKVLDIARDIFERHNYKHIWTPAVESVDILKKWWDIIDKQVFGLYGLAQWVEDVKDYALHFDLTVPFARYVLDHRNDLTFPFSRYQMQPVRRGERTKRWRFKEFRQMDIDTIWPSESHVWVRYDVQSVAVMDKAMRAICAHFDLDIDFSAKVSHILVTKNYLASLGMSAEQIETICKILDNYFKKEEATSHKELVEVMWNEKADILINIIHTKDYTLLSWVEGYNTLSDIMISLKQLWIHADYDICIVRWHNYYSGMVIERFDNKDISFGTLAAGGRYDNLTAFIDKKQSFSWVGTSLGRFAYLVVEIVSARESTYEDTYMFVNFEDTYGDILELYKKFMAAWKVCDIYPTAAKLSKQFEYADRAGTRYCVLYGAGEKEKNMFMIKDLQTGESYECGFEESYGIIPIAQLDGETKIAIVQHPDGHRGFPKWHPEWQETSAETAMRECAEETWLRDIVLDENKVLEEYYFIANKQWTSKKWILKKVGYFVWDVKESLLTVQTEELRDVKWFTPSQALALPLFPSMSNLIKQAEKIIT